MLRVPESRRRSGRCGGHRDRAGPCCRGGVPRIDHDHRGRHPAGSGPNRIA